MEHSQSMLGDANSACPNITTTSDLHFKERPNHWLPIHPPTRPSVVRITWHRLFIISPVSLHCKPCICEAIVNIRSSWFIKTTAGQHASITQHLSPRQSRCIELTHPNDNSSDPHFIPFTYEMFLLHEKFRAFKKFARESQVSTVNSLHIASNEIQSNDKLTYLDHDIDSRVVRPIVFPHPQSSCSARSHPSPSIFLALFHRLSISRHPHLPAVRYHPPNPVIHLPLVQSRLFGQHHPTPLPILSLSCLKVGSYPSKVDSDCECGACVNAELWMPWIENRLRHW